MEWHPDLHENRNVAGCVEEGAKAAVDLPIRGWRGGRSHSRCGSGSVSGRSTCGLRRCAH
eukprot:6180710-Pyramimonas_sp.AAC.1